MYATQLDDNYEITFEVGTTRQVYLKLMEGTAKVNGIAYEAGDAAEVARENISIVGIDKAHILLVEMQK